MTFDPPNINDRQTGIDLLPGDEHTVDTEPVDIEPDETEADEQAPRKASHALREWLIVVFIAISAAVLMKLFVVQQFYVKGQSMEHTLSEQDRVLVNKLSYRLHDPNRGDVIVLERHGNSVSAEDLIKRVIAVPGETIEIKSCEVYINDIRLIEPYINQDDAVLADLSSRCGTPNMGAKTIGKDQVFVMGDNRAHSGDSRSFGAVPYDDIVGRAFVVIWPTSNWRWL